MIKIFTSQDLGRTHTYILYKSGNILIITIHYKLNRRGKFHTLHIS